MPHWEYKFVFRDNRAAPALFALIRDLRDLTGFESRWREDRSTINRDAYFDAPDLALEAQGMVCRVRQGREGGPRTLVVKRQSLGPNREVVYPHTPPMTIDDRDYAGLLGGVFPADLGPLLALFADSDRLEHVLTLEVQRTVIELKDRGGILAELHLDVIHAMLPGRSAPVSEDYEIELKSERPEFPAADVLRDFLVNAFGMVPVTRSKLRRMAGLVRGHRQGGPCKVLLDMDTGVDDALALVLAMQSPELEVLGVTSVGGNIEADQAALNTAAVLTHIHPFVKDRYPRPPGVARGEKQAHGRPTAGDVHGLDGLGGVSGEYLTEAAKNLVGKRDALDLFTSTVERHPGRVTLITTGPLTNLARFIAQRPETVKKLRQIIAMGGVFFKSGNRSQAAEFNVHFDPASARRVVEFCRTPLSPCPGRWHEAVPLTFVGLDVTHQVRLRRESLSPQGAGDERRDFLRRITEHYMGFYLRNEGLDGCYLHDPLAVALAVDPSLCHAEQYHVEVEDRGEYTSGTTVADYRPTRLFKDKMKEVTWVCYKVDGGRFEGMFEERVLGQFRQPPDGRYV